MSVPSSSNGMPAGPGSAQSSTLNDSSGASITNAKALIEHMNGTATPQLNGEHDTNGHVLSPMQSFSDARRAVLECRDDGAVFSGYSFGAAKSVAGELVFQTGMVGYPESITDPSYCGQILVITFPLVGNYGVPSRTQEDLLLKSLPAHFESAQIHIVGLVVATYAGETYSHHLATSSLGTWLKEQGIPAIFGVDTRALTKKIRDSGSMLGRLLMAKNDPNLLHHEPISFGNGPDQSTRQQQLEKDYECVEWRDPNKLNLVAEVSCREPYSCQPLKDSALRHPSGRNLRIICIDVGLKYNQLRCLVSRGVEVHVVPWNFDFLSYLDGEFDGLFLSNGPGDPAMLSETVKNIHKTMVNGNVPIFGICLGHQLMARAAGATTLKMKFGNRGHNIPCTNRISGKCYITSQNHGFAVDATNLPGEWEELFFNANDGSNEGIRHRSRPFFSVQFHPESTPGPRDTEFLFDVFINTIKQSIQDVKYLLKPVVFPGGTQEENERLHPRVQVRKVLVLGSGGLSIGQAGEFDYSGSQAIKALKQEGIYTVLINPNIATIQTSKGLADKVYFLPVTADSVRKVINYEHPDAIYVTFGGQTALQVGIQLKDEFARLGVQVLGTPIDTIITTEDRELFARSMESIGEKCAVSASASSIPEALRAVEHIGFPVIVRAAYALGGLGSGFAENNEQLLDLCNKAFAASPQVLIERSMKGWKEIEYEVVRDAQDNCITVCNMENFDPLGIHTGDSIVVAPSQTLSDEDYNMLRTTAVNVIRHLGVVGECNIQYALNPFSKEYCIIEVNARLSRSSALASKATGYPLAFVAAKLGLGTPLNEIKNSVTRETCACFEPSLDYVVVKIPRWDLKKFTRVSTALNSSMKSVGEVMSIGRTFEEAIQKAIRAVDFHNLGFNETSALMSIDNELQTPSDQRMFAIANAMHAGYSVGKIWEMTQIDKWFLHRLKGLSDFGKMVSNYSAANLPASLLRRAKELGFSDRQLAKFLSTDDTEIKEQHVRQMRLDLNMHAYVKQIDTVAAEFPAFTNYLYLTYNGREHDVQFNDNGIMVLGSGAYRIGSSVEFDWCSVRAIRTLRNQGHKTVMVNYNPETVSTDYDEADRLYFENIDLETVLEIYKMEMSKGVVISMGGQTPNNIAMQLGRYANILGTSPEKIDMAENRYNFSKMLDEMGVDQPAWKEMTTIEQALDFCNKVGYPVLVRPSYVLSGAAMNTVYSEHDLQNYLYQATEVSRDYPVVITKYIENAKEIEMDAVANNGKMIGHFISEHVENAGVHSGDATLILPPQDLDPETVRRIEEATRKIGKALEVKGPFNIQFIAKDNEIKVIECNVRASRSFPFVSKVMGVDLIEMATKAIVDAPVQEYPPVDIPADYVGVKVPQFSFSRLSGADPVLGVEMASTGEVACFGRDKYEAYLKALLSTGFRLPKKNILLSIGSYKDKAELLPSIRKLHQLGYKLFATAGTADFIEEHGVPIKYLEILSNQMEDQKHEYSLTQHLANNLIDLYINLPSKNRYRRPASYLSTGYRTRRMAVDYQTPLVTNVKNAKILIEAISRNYQQEIISVDYQTSYLTLSLPALINISAFIPGLVSPNSYDLELVTKASVAAGFGMIRVMPLGLEGSLTDAQSLKLAQANACMGAYCDYNFSVAATATNSARVSQIMGQVGSLFIPFNHLSNNISKTDAITAHFDQWPAYKPIITDASTTHLATLLLLASLHNRKLHVTSVSTAEDIRLIALSKSKGLAVTCDVAVYSLFLSKTDFPKCSFLPTEKDQQVLWDHFSCIDILSVGSLPYQLAVVEKQDISPAVGIADTLPLLLTAVSDGRLSIEDIVARMHTNPKTIFDLHEQEGSLVEIELGRSYITQATSTWSPIVGRRVKGAVTRVRFQGKTICLDGKLSSDPPLGHDMSTHLATQIDGGVAQTPLLVHGTTPKSPLARRWDDISYQQLPVESTLGKNLSTSYNIVSARSPFDTLPSLPSVLYPASVLSTSALRRLSDPTFKNIHVVSVDQFNRNALQTLIDIAHEMKLGVEKYGVLDILRGRILCTAFYEPSSRTSMSFEVAMERLGGQSKPLPADSSIKKGESLKDTLRTLGSYANAIVLRHPDANAAFDAIQAAQVPVISGGFGAVEHPTQAFLDLYTIIEELGRIDGLTITFVGDLRFGRTVHSLVKLLCHFDVQIQLVAPEGLALPYAFRQSIITNGRAPTESQSLDSDIIRQTDVLYCTRVQQERFDDPTEYERLKHSYTVDATVMQAAKQKMIVMHPLPRNEELSEEVDSDPRAAYFRQMNYGMYCRMALLALVMSP